MRLDQMMRAAWSIASVRLSANGFPARMESDLPIEGANDLGVTKERFHGICRRRFLECKGHGGPKVSGPVVLQLREPDGKTSEGAALDRRVKTRPLTS